MVTPKNERSRGNARQRAIEEAVADSKAKEGLIRYQACERIGKLGDRSDTVVDSLKEFTGQTPQSDDITIVIVKRT